MSRRSGSPSVRMIVGRSSDSAAGCGIFSRARWRSAWPACYNFSMFPNIWKYRDDPRVRAAYALVTGVIGLALFASATPSPLYGTYRELWGFSPAVLTLVYATYAFGVLAALLLAGRVSDEVGRRPVLLVALERPDGHVGAVHGRRLGDVAVRRARPAGRSPPAWRSARPARRMLDLHPRRDPAGVGLANGVVSAAGMGLGVLVSSAIVEWLPAPRVLPYVVLLVLFAISLAGALADARAGRERSRLRLTPQRPQRPPAVRRPFLLAALAVFSSWSIGGLFLSLGPQLTATIFDSDDHLVAGLGVFLLAGSGAVAQLLFGGRMAAWRGATFGSLALAGGVLLIVGAASTESAALLLERRGHRRRGLRRSRSWARCARCRA